MVHPNCKNKLLPHTFIYQTSNNNYFNNDATSPEIGVMTKCVFFNHLNIWNLVT
ncbi:hypothetical protein Lalb_Chr09g0326481 [Lupinus albus]|uniref:Uncharacterized protein n=1 Tax=Lupinus albus TaxID=3870 RepID=A0A6A4Q007_LUPAL|nr:hypothetical protein Lalb_Chr09g0326481 [Lupinus albus]